MRIENRRFYESIAGQVDFIVSDRGWLCHLAYTDHNVDEEFTRQLYVDFLEAKTYLPDRCYLFEVSADEAARRRASRGRAADAIELKGDDFQRRVAESYRKYAEIYAGDFDIRIIDSSGTKESVAAVVIAEAEELLDA